MAVLEKNWLDSLGLSSRRIYERNWEYFKEFTGLDADQILDSKKTDGNRMWKAKLMQFKQWMQDNKGLSQNSAKTATGVVRGFFAFCETPIFMTKAERQRIDKAGRSTKDYKFTRKDMAKMALVSSLDEKYILLFGKSVGFRANDFVKFTYGDFRSLDLESDVPIYMGEFNTQKKAIPANPFIDVDSLPVIKAILEANTRKKDSDRIITIRGGELSVILQRIADRAKINYGNARVRFHCLRKWLVTRLSATMSESQWKQIVGKSISEDAYVSTDLLRTAYSNALKDLTVLTNNGNGHSAKVEMLQEAITQLEKENYASKTRIDLLQKTLAEQKEGYDQNFEQLFTLIRNSIKTDNLKIPSKGTKFVKGPYRREIEQSEKKKEEWNEKYPKLVETNRKRKKQH